MGILYVHSLPDANVCGTLNMSDPPERFQQHFIAALANSTNRAYIANVCTIRRSRRLRQSRPQNAAAQPRDVEKTTIGGSK
jgi:hypothetical protein